MEDATILVPFINLHYLPYASLNTTGHENVSNLHKNVCKHYNLIYRIIFNERVD